MGFSGMHNHSVHSNYRLRDALGKVPDIIERAHELKYKGIAFTEHECITSSLEANKFYYAHKDLPEWEGFKVILGNEIYLCPSSVTSENKKENIYPHFILLAKDEIGHRQIRQLSTIAWSHSFMDIMMRVPTYYTDLEEIILPEQGHIVGSSACLGSSIARRILQLPEHPEYYESCLEWCTYINSIFGQGNFFLEMQPSNNEDQIYVNKILLKISQELNIPFIVTTDTHYIRKEDQKIHKIFLNSQDGDREVDSFYASTYMMSEQEIHEYMDESLSYDIVRQAIDNTDLIYDMITEYNLEKPLHIPYLPKDLTEPNQFSLDKWKKQIPLFEYFFYSKTSSDRHMARELLKHLDDDIDYQNEQGFKSISECLEAIKLSSEKMNVHWSAYLMQLRDYIKIAWDCDTLVGVGRGSGVGFCLLHMLDITQINPLKENTKTFYWRFMNPYRTSVLDIDTDIQSNRRDKVIEGLKQAYGEDRVSKVMTISTEGTRSAILTAARGLGIDNDEAQYIASLVVADRGQSRTLKQMYYGDEENDYKPVYDFIKEMNDHPDLWDAAQKIEGVINGVGSHAGGVVIVDEPFYNSTALMKTSSGDVITQFDLHSLEDVSLIKIDLLCIEALDKIRAELDLLLKDKVIQWQGSLKDTYENYLGVYKIERNNTDMWNCLLQHKVFSFFQMEKDSGYKAISIGQPQSVDDLAAINTVMRLMPQSKNDIAPIDKFGKYKANIDLWYEEMHKAGLTSKEQKLLEPILVSSYGVCQSQEQMMQVVQVPECGGFDLVWADSLRKSVAKKNPKAFNKLEEEYLTTVKEKGLSQNLCKYVWYTLIYGLRGYGFPASHGLAYSMIGLQELNLYYHYNPIYWTCANLIVDSGSSDENTENKSTNYGKIAIAVNTIKKTGVTIANPLINSAKFGYIPDIKNNRIIVGLKAINGIGDDIAQSLIVNAPYTSFQDFCIRMIDTKIVSNSQMIALIKAGCFLELDSVDRMKTMSYYINTYLFSNTTKLTMSQFAKIQEFNLIPLKLQEIVKINNFKDYVLNEDGFIKTIIEPNKKIIPKCGYHDRCFSLDHNSQAFFQKHFSEESVIGIEKGFYLISEKKFLKELNLKLQPLRDWFEQEETLNLYNQAMFDNIFMEKVKSNNVNKWSMDVLTYYDNDHELKDINNQKYDIINFTEQPEIPEMYDSYSKYINGVRHIFPKKTIHRIAGTVISSDNNHAQITLLTVYGVINVKLNKGQYAYYGKRISKTDKSTGKKHVMDESWFKRGTLLLVCGYREEAIFRAYRYNDTVFTHTVNKIIEINKNHELIIINERGDTGE